jgi:hypothetical protein
MQLPDVPVDEMRKSAMRRFGRGSALLLTFAAAMLAPILAGCIIGGKEDKPQGSEIENELGARIYLADGTPAAGATVKVYPVDQSPKSALPKSGRALGPVFATRTDAKGRYSLDSLPRGEYNILSEKDGEVAYQDSVFIAGIKASILADTLRDPGSVAGRIVMQPKDDPRSATVELLGTNVFVNLDVQGRFILRGLAAGAYRARAVATAPEYTPTYFPLQVVSGRDDTLPEPVVLTYTGIPVVQNIRATLDTLLGDVRVEWSPVEYLNLQDYVVYAGNPGTFLESTVIGITSDTSFTYHAWQTESGGRLEYRVAVRNKSLQTGLTYASVKLDLVPPAMAVTRLSMRLAGTHGNEASVHDSVRIVLDYDNPTRANRRIIWKTDAAGILRDVQATGRSGSDTLAYSWDEAGRPEIDVSVYDDAGNVWKGVFAPFIVTDPPVALPWPTKFLAGAPGETLRVRAGDSDRFGRIVSWEWDFGARGLFVPSPGPDTSLLVSDPMDFYPVAVRVADDDGNRSVDTFYVTAVSRITMISLDAGIFLRSDGKSIAVGKFSIGATEVTRARYFEIMGEDPSLTGPGRGPVNNVDIPSAMEFCNRLSEREGRPPVYDLNDPFSKPGKGGYRLPTPAEWEYAARAGSDASYWQDRDAEAMDKTTWFKDNSGERAHAVAQKEPNGFGLFDMDGNVSEWLEYYDPARPYPHGMDYMGSNFKTDYHNSGYTNGWLAELGHLHGSAEEIGFRVVLDE